ncbi:coniferyl alcohol acyltransferase-like [Cryptomeria japonica]|uniref:coniferyl alcohol acyltransferase-like n=1 Tax=Cryptomeria japonica TaxID=3369 RepID=UPI0027DA9044|nr:coniferyl alcohol acyltransferase-like [Cryptomeria japonica]
MTCGTDVMPEKGLETGRAVGKGPLQVSLLCLDAGTLWERALVGGDATGDSQLGWGPASREEKPSAKRGVEKSRIGEVTEHIILSTLFAFCITILTVFRYLQVTEFGCGGLVIGCTFDHRIADAYSANMFFTIWAKLSRNDSTASLNPSITRSILCPRDSPAHCAEINNMYVRHCSQEFSQENPHPPSLVSRIYYLDVKNIMDLQFNAKKDGKSNTKLEVFSAYLWKLLISSHKVKDTINCKIGIVVDGRQHLREIGISANYFGNVLTLPFAESNAGYIKSKPLCWSAGLIHDAIKSAANEEHFQSLIDFVETTKPTPVLAKIYCGADDMESSGPAVLVSSGLWFPLYEVDFGWGKPTFVSYHFPWGAEAGYVMPTHSPLGDGSWIVYMHLPM